MELETSKKILKVFGIINIVFGILGVICGIAAITGSAILGIGVAHKTIEATNDIGNGMILLGAVGVLLIIFSAIDIIEGIFDCNAAKDPSKVMPAWIFSIISLICSIYSIVSLVINRNFTSSSLFGVAVSIVISIITFMAANSVKQAAGK